MTIQEIVDKAEGGLVEVPRLDWLALLKGIETVADTVHARWLTDLIFGAENADGQQFVVIEKTQAKAMCGLAVEKD